MELLNLQISEVLNSALEFFTKRGAIITALLLGLTSYYPVINKINMYSTFSDFDSLFIPKHEANIRRFIKNISTILFIVLAYIFMGFLVALGITLLFKINIFLEYSSWVINGFTIIYTISTLPMLINLFLSINLNPGNIARKRFEKFKLKKTIKVNYHLNYALSIIMEGILILDRLFLTKINLLSVVTIIVYPIFLLYLYRNYNSSTAKKTHFIVTVIEEKDFNSSSAIMQYTLDQNRLVFKSNKANDKAYYLFDRNNNKYYRYLPTE